MLLANLLKIYEKYEEEKDLDNRLMRMRDEGVRVAEFHTKFES